VKLKKKPLRYLDELPKFLSELHGESPSFLRKQESSFLSGFPPSRERRARFRLRVSRVDGHYFWQPL